MIRLLPGASTFRPSNCYICTHEIDDVDGDLLVIYHSHVASEARPSPTDLNIARLHKGATEWPYWVLVSLADEPPSVRAWRIDDGEEPDTVVASEIDLMISDVDGVRRRLEMIEVNGRPRVQETAL